MAVPYCYGYRPGRTYTYTCLLLDPAKTVVMGKFSTSIYDGSFVDLVRSAKGVASFIKMNGTCPSARVSRNDLINACKASGDYKDCNMALTMLGCSVDRNDSKLLRRDQVVLYESGMKLYTSPESDKREFFNHLNYSN